MSESYCAFGHAKYQSRCSVCVSRRLKELEAENRRLREDLAVCDVCCKHRARDLGTAMELLKGCLPCVNPETSNWQSHLYDLVKEFLVKGKTNVRA